MTDAPAFDHAKVSTLLRIIHDTVNMPGLEAIRDAANAELIAISAPIVAAKTKATADAKAKHAALSAEAAAKHKNLGPAAANLTALRLAAHDAEVAAEKNPTAANVAAHEAAEKTYADALKSAEIAANPPKAMPANQVPTGPTAAEPVKRV